MNKDLTTGDPGKVLRRFCLPMFASMIFQQLYNMTDSFVAGKFIGNDALAAVGNSYEITLIFIAFAFGCNIGCSVISSQLFGSKNLKDLKTAVYTSLISSGILCIVLMLAGLLFCDNVLQLIHTPANIYEDSKTYLNIYLYGLPFIFMYNVATGIFTALGDSKTPFIFLACSSIANIGLDILFVVVFNMNIAGTAWATFVCQGVSCILALTFVFRRFSKIETTEKVPIFSWHLFGRIAKVAIPSIFQQSFISVGNVIIQGAINGFGSAVVAGYSASIKLNNMVITSLVTLANGVSNFTAQNLGAGQFDRIKQGFKAGIKLIVSICIPIFLIYFFFGRQLVYIFLDSPEGQAIEVGTTFLRIVSPFYLVIALKLVSDGVLRGAGMMARFMTATFIDLVLRVVLSIVLSKTALGATGIWASWPVGWVISSIVAFVFYLRINWKKVKL